MPYYTLYKRTKNAHETTYLDLRPHYRLGFFKEPMQITHLPILHTQPIYNAHRHYDQSYLMLTSSIGHFVLQ